MKKNEAGLETRIVDTALAMFNEKGIEYVGMRELAGALGISIGNLNYYFPTKDELVNRISLNLAQENSSTIVSPPDMTMPVFFDMLERVFKNHLRYSCLMLSFVHIVQRNHIIAKRYSKTFLQRNAAWTANIKALIDSRYIVADEKEVGFLVASIAFIARFWISEAVISFRDMSSDQQMRSYLKMIARIFLPYATAKGRRFLNQFLNQ